MLLAGLLIASSLSAEATSPVPGMCAAPAAENVEKPGCYLSAEMTVKGAPETVYWHIYQLADEAAGRAEAAKHRWATTIIAHKRIWLYVLGGPDERIGVGRKAAVIGPLRVPSGAVNARFMESIFPPRMRTRVHSHAGPEAFYVVEGEQCMDSPSERRKLGAGATYVVESGPHVQAAPKGRRNLVLVLAPTSAAWMALRNDWTPSGFCDR